jgi:hypothetical protein
LKFREEQYTKMEDILYVVQNILSWKEKRFEIDL